MSEEPVRVRISQWVRFEREVARPPGTSPEQARKDARAGLLRKGWRWQELVDSRRETVIAEIEEGKADA